MANRRARAAAGLAALTRPGQAEPGQAERVRPDRGPRAGRTDRKRSARIFWRQPAIRGAGPA